MTEYTNVARMKCRQVHNLWTELYEKLKCNDNKIEILALREI